MIKNPYIFGILGAVLLIFGGATYLLVGFDEYHIAEIHLISGSILILFFVLSGGFSLFLKKKSSENLSVTVIRQSIERKRFLLEAFNLLLVFLIVIAVNYLIYTYDPIRIDTTSEKVFTLAPQTESVLNGLKTGVVARGFFVGGQVDSNIRDLFERMSRVSRNFRFQIIDPEKQPGMVEKYGVNERDTVHFSFDMPEATRSVKIVRKIDEQEIVNAILKLTRGGEKVVYFLEGHAEGELSSAAFNGFVFLKEAVEGENISVRNLRLEAVSQVPEDASSLVLLAPKRPIEESSIEVLSNYIKRGGSLIFLNETNAESGLEKFFRNYGIIIGRDVVLDKEIREFSGATMSVEPLVDNFGIHEITNNFKETILFSTTTSVRRADIFPTGVRILELAFTGPNSWAETKVSQVFSDDPKAALENDDIRGPVSVAIAYEALVDKRPSRIVVFGDSDFVNNQNIRRAFNRDFFLNSLNWVIGEEEGITIRAKSLLSSTKVISAKEFRGIFLFSAIIFPELILILGIYIWVRNIRGA